MIKKNRGFSLLELIIAIAILVILTGLLAPQFMKYLDKSRRAVCLNTMDTLAGEYSMGIIDVNQAPDDATAKKTLDRIMEGHGGKNNLAASSVVYLYSGLCKSGGHYQCQFYNNLTSVHIKCSKHGEWNIDVVTLKEALENIDLTDYQIPKNQTPKYKNISDYFTEFRKSIDSEAISTDNRYGDDGSLANILAKELKKTGINLENKSWKLYKSGNTYELYLTDREITVDDAKTPNTRISCTKYNINAKEGEPSIVKGEIKITTSTVNNSTYPVIDNSKGSFQELDNK